MRHSRRMAAKRARWRGRGAHWPPQQADQESCDETNPLQTPPSRGDVLPAGRVVTCNRKQMASSSASHRAAGNICRTSQQQQPPEGIPPMGSSISHHHHARHSPGHPPGHPPGHLPGQPAPTATRADRAPQPDERRWLHLTCPPPSAATPPATPPASSNPTRVIDHRRRCVGVGQGELERGRAPLPARLVTLLAGWCMLLVGVAAAETASGRADFWLDRVGGLSAWAGGGQLEVGVTQRLAAKMAEQVDQRKSALLYLDLLAYLRPISSNKNDNDNHDDDSDDDDVVDDSSRHLSASCPSVGLDELLGDLQHAAPRHLLDQPTANKLMAAPPGQTGAELEAAAQLALDNANLLSQLLVHAHDNELARRLASRRLAQYLVSSRLKLASNRPRGLHSLGLAFLEQHTGSWQVTFAPVGRASGSLVSDLARSRWTATRPLPPFIGEWTRPGEDSGSGGEGAAGRWFWPHFDCSRWLLTFSAPFYGLHAPAAAQTSRKSAAATDEQDDGPHSERRSLRGVAFASIDLARTRLMDQCPPIGFGAAADSHAPFSFLAGTHQCPRQRGSQCRPLAQRASQIRSGQYLCQCGEPASMDGPAATPTTSNRTRPQDEPPPPPQNKHRDELAAIVSRLLESSSTATKTAPLNNQQPPPATLGARLEAADRLEWLSSGRAGGQPEWGAWSCACHAPHSAACLEADGEAEADWRSWWAAWAVVGAQSSCAAASLCLLGGLLWLRKSRIILTSGWLMLETMLLGALLLYLSVLVRYFQASSLTCLLEPWLRELGFSVFHGSILIKLYKLLTEFQTRRAHRVHFRDKDQIALLSAIVLIVVGYMSAWTALTIDASSSTLSWPQLAGSPNRTQLASSPDGALSLRLDEPANTWLLLPPVGQVWARLAALFVGLVEPGGLRCRKLTWDYVTELSELSLLVFGLYLAYRLRRATAAPDEGHRERLVLSGAVLLELAVSGATYGARHALWPHLLAPHLLLVYALRCQLTVTPTLALILAPKLWTAVGRSKQTLVGAQRAGSVRHRCHLSCELHDHHLNDAMRLHQAMLSSNAALDIGTIDLADMDPDVIQAELKRVYTQLEVLKTKVMRRDNPHISKRRGGRATKSGHRKFSLQAFHPRNIGAVSKLGGTLSSGSASGRRPLQGQLAVQPEASDLDEETTQLQADTTTLAGEELSRSSEPPPPPPKQAEAPAEVPRDELAKSGKQQSRSIHTTTPTTTTTTTTTDNSRHQRRHHHHHHHRHRHHRQHHQQQQQHAAHNKSAKTGSSGAETACDMASEWRPQPGEQSGG